MGVDPFPNAAHKLARSLTEGKVDSRVLASCRYFSQRGFP
jgi:hypothetical protein